MFLSLSASIIHCGLLLLLLHFVIIHSVEWSGTDSFCCFNRGSNFHETLVMVESLLTEFFLKGIDELNGLVHLSLVIVIRKK